jgi:hypothetical protein
MITAGAPSLVVVGPDGDPRGVVTLETLAGLAR